MQHIKADDGIKKLGATTKRFLPLILKVMSKAIFMPLFYIGKSSYQRYFLSYQPDSRNVHNEFKALYKKFIKYNRLNNAGDLTRLWSFILNLKQVVNENIMGDFAELGVWRGNTAAVLAHIALSNKRQIFLFDTYEGFNSKDFTGVDADKKVIFNNTSLDLVKEVVGENNASCHFVKGHFPGSITEDHKAIKYAAVSLDCDLYEPMRAGLQFFYSRMPIGGLFLLHDYSSMRWTGAKQAVDEFCKDTGEFVVLMPDKSGSAFLRKTK